MADARLAMANRPSHPPCLSRAPVYQATKRKLEDLSDSDSDQRETSPNFAPQSRYQHFSALRTTGEPREGDKVTGLRKRRVLEEKPAFRTMNIAVSSACEECVQECEDGSCDLELTEQCTDQCIVVPCNDAHHGYASCETANAIAGCDIMCTDGTDCDALDTIVSLIPPPPSHRPKSL